LIAGRPSLSAIPLGSPLRATIVTLSRPPQAARASSGATPWLESLTALLVTLPVFLQAPWVRVAPGLALLFTIPLLAVGIGLGSRSPARTQGLGMLLVGFSGSWLAGCLFWGWCRMHPLWHLPIEALALPLALTGLGTRWRLAAGFYLGSLAGTACTDGVIALCGLMPLWPAVLGAGPGDAAVLLQQAALQLLSPLPLAAVLCSAALLLALCRRLAGQGDALRLAATALATTLAVDGLFLALALLAPRLSGLI
jgi:hypothetical protein